MQPRDEIQLHHQPHRQPCPMPPAPHSLYLFADGQHHDTFTTDTREELDEAVAYAERIKGRRRERERPLLTVDVLPFFVRAVVDAFTEALPPPPLMRVKNTPEMTLHGDLKMDDCCVVIERCNAL